VSALASRLLPGAFPSKAASFVRGASSASGPPSGAIAQRGVSDETRQRCRGSVEPRDECSDRSLWRRNAIARRSPFAPSPGAVSVAASYWPIG